MQIRNRTSIVVAGAAMTLAAVLTAGPAAQATTTTASAAAVPTAVGNVVNPTPPDEPADCHGPKDANQRHRTVNSNISMHMYNVAASPVVLVMHPSALLHIYYRTWNIHGNQWWVVRYSDEIGNWCGYVFSDDIVWNQ